MNIKNIILNFYRQFLTLFVGFWITCYLSNVLGANGFGEYTFYISIASLLFVFASFAITQWGVKILSQNSDGETFWNLLTINIATSLIVSVLIVILWLIGVFSWPQTIFFLVYVFFLSFDLTWYYLAKEKLIYVSIITTITRIINLLLIFFLVKDSGDLFNALLVTVFITVLNSILLFFGVSKNEGKVQLKKNIGKHSKEIVAVFIPFLFISLYTIVDKIILGWLSTYDQVAIYNNVMLIFKSTLIFITTVSPFIMIQIANHKSREDLEKLIKQSFIISVHGAIFVIACLALNSQYIVGLFFRNGYDDMINYLIVFSPIVLFTAISSSIAGQYFIGHGKLKKFTLMVCYGSLINLVLNILLAPKLGAMGSLIATSVAEFFIMSYAIYSVKQYIKFRSICLMFLKALIPLTITVAIVYIIPEYSLLIDLVINVTLTCIIFGSFFFIFIWKEFKKTYVSPNKLENQ